MPTSIYLMRVINLVVIEKQNSETSPLTKAQNVPETMQWTQQ